MHMYAVTVSEKMYRILIPGHARAILLSQIFPGGWLWFLGKLPRKCSILSWAHQLGSSNLWGRTFWGIFVWSGVSVCGFDDVAPLISEIVLFPGTGAAVPKLMPVDFVPLENWVGVKNVSRHQYSRLQKYYGRADPHNWEMTQNWATIQEVAAPRCKTVQKYHTWQARGSRTRGEFTFSPQFLKGNWAQILSTMHGNLGGHHHHIMSLCLTLFSLISFAGKIEEDPVRSPRSI